MQSERSIWQRPVAASLMLAGLMAALVSAPRAQHTTETSADVAAARQLFDANLDAIRRRDRDAYLATYLQSESLARSGVSGLQLGYAGHAAGASGGNWPDVFVARNLQLVALRPGVVFGSYRYRVAYGTDEHIGISERVFVDTPDGWRIAMTSAFDVPRGTPPPPLALRGATLVTGTGAAPIVNATVLVRAGRIECAGAPADCTIPEDVEVVDVSGTWITPGIIDVHVHLSQSGWLDSATDSSAASALGYEHVQSQLRARSGRTLRSVLGSGVTALFDVGGAPWTWSLRDTLGTDQPHVAAAGPVLSTRALGAQRSPERPILAVGSPATAREAVRYLAAWESNGVTLRVVPSGGRDEHSSEIILDNVSDEARAAGLPLLVHPNAQHDAKLALAAGAHLLVQGVADTEIDDEFIQLAITQGTIYCPTLGLWRAYERGLDGSPEDRSAMAPDPHACAAPRVANIDAVAAPSTEPDASKRSERLRAQLAMRHRVARDNLLRAQRAGIPVAVGSESGGVLAPRDAVYAEMEAMQDAGLTPAQVLESATRIGALALGREADLGTLEAGKIADLLVVDADPTQDIGNIRALRYIMRGGELRGASEYRP